MDKLGRMLLACLICAGSGIASAQPGGGPGSAPPSAGPSASARGMGMGAAHGTARWGPDFTPGWAMMTEQEREAHRGRLRSMRTHEECQAYMAQHHEEMSARPRERGGKPTSKPRHDACAGLK